MKKTSETHKALRTSYHFELSLNSSGYTKLFLEQVCSGVKLFRGPRISMPVIHWWNICGFYLVKDLTSKENLGIVIDLNATAQSYLLMLTLALLHRIQITGIKLPEWAKILSTFCFFYQAYLNILTESYLNSACWSSSSTSYKSGWCWMLVLTQ